MILNRWEYWLVGSETGTAILESINGILAAVGQGSYDEFRGRVGESAMLLRNLAVAAEAVAKLTDQDLAKLIEGLQDPERTLRLMEDLNDYLPKIRVKVVEAAAIFPQDLGGPPPIFKSREEERELCRLILKYVEQGDSEAKAKKRAKLTLATRKVDASLTTINRVWARRAEILNEPTFEEFFGDLLRSWSKGQEKVDPPPVGDKLSESSEQADLPPVDAGDKP
jgi:hypothetical protein